MKDLYHRIKGPNIRNALVYAFLFLMALPSVASAAGINVLGDLKDIGTAVYGTDKAADLKQVVASLVQIVLGFVGIIFVILIIWGGLEWMTSGGNEQKIESAKNRIKNATIGLVLVVLAYTIAYTITRWLSIATGGAGGSGGIPQNGGT